MRLCGKHVYVMSAADSAHRGSACIATTEQMPSPTLTEVEIRRTDGSLHTCMRSCGKQWACFNVIVFIRLYGNEWARFNVFVCIRLCGNEWACFNVIVCMRLCGNEWACFNLFVH